MFCDFSEKYRVPRVLVKILTSFPGSSLFSYFIIGDDVAEDNGYTYDFFFTTFRKNIVYPGAVKISTSFPGSSFFSYFITVLKREDPGMKFVKISCTCDNWKYFEKLKLVSTILVFLNKVQDFGLKTHTGNLLLDHSLLLARYHIYIYIYIYI